jgi:hypothetical protein
LKRRVGAQGAREDATTQEPGGRRKELRERRVQWIPP